MLWRGKLARFAVALDTWLLGSLYQLRRANTIVRSKVAASSPEEYQADARLGHTGESLEDALRESFARIGDIETKAQSTLLGITLSVTIIGSSSALLGDRGLLSDVPFLVRLVSASFLLVGAAFLLTSGYLALQAYRIGQIYHPTLHDRRPVAGAKEERCVLLYCVEQNHKVGTVKANLLSASFDCLRNGLLLIAALGVLTVWSSLWAC